MYRNKQSIVLDLKSDEGRAIALQLLDKADVLVENFRPGVLDRLGLGEDVLRARNPRLVTVRISGYGQTGPYRDFARLRGHLRCSSGRAPSHRRPRPAAGALLVAYDRLT